MFLFMARLSKRFMARISERCSPHVLVYGEAF